MKRVGVVILVAAMLGSLVVLAGSSKGGDRTEGLGSMTEQLIQLLETRYSRQELEGEDVYVGSEFCISCHQGHAGWRDTKHAQALRRPMAQYSLMAGKGVVADYDRNGVDDFMQGLDFNQISSVFDPYKPNAPKLSYSGGAYYITIGEAMMPVVCTQGGTGDWKQRYLLRVPASDKADGYSAENYVSPVQYNEKTYEYVLYHPEAWYDGSNQPRFGAQNLASTIAANNGRTYSKKCIGCHTTGVNGVSQDANGEWIYDASPAVLYHNDNPGYFDYDHDGHADLVNIGCESCHGPGGKHILGGGDPAQIANPAEMDTEKSNEICGQCHVRVKSVPGKIHDWPYNDGTGKAWIPGTDDSLSDYYTNAAGYWPDGKTSKQHHQQYFDLYESSKPTFPWHPIKCVECHNPHFKTANSHQVVDAIVDDGLVIPTSYRNNTLCLACHATHGDFEEITPEQVADYGNNVAHIGEVVSAHTHHPYDPEGWIANSRCTGCHMPKTAKSAISYDIHSHTFEPIAPGKTLDTLASGGMPNACSVSCHWNLPVNYGGCQDINVWNDQYDVKTGTMLEHYYGPGGLWWDTGHTGGRTEGRPDMKPAHSITRNNG